MQTRTECGCCGSKDIVKVIDLGKMPFANSYIKKEDLGKPEPYYPLTVGFCRDCYSLQILDLIEPSDIFIDYAYLTSASQPMIDHFQKMARDLADRFIKSHLDLVVEVGGNDGTLLEAIKDRCMILNIDPSKKAGELSRAKGVPTITDFFNRQFVESNPYWKGKAKLVIGNNVFAHIPDLRDAVQGVSDILRDDGVFVLENHWLGDLIQGGGFDQIYHEHCFYHSLTSLKSLLESVGLYIFEVEMIPFHGESMRIYVAKNQVVLPMNYSVDELLKREYDLGLDREDTFIRLGRRIKQCGEICSSLIEGLQGRGRKIVGYGAPAKGNILLNYCHLPLDYLTDTTPAKQGTYSPGMHIPIYHPDKLKYDPPDYVLLLAWNYADAIIEKERDLLDSGVVFLTPRMEARAV